MIFQGEKNPNFTFEKLDEKFRIEAKKWLPIVKDDYQILYAWQLVNIDIAFIVFWDCRDNKIYILRMFAMNNELGASLDVERSLKTPRLHRLM